jgi:hypothetical protein
MKTVLVFVGLLLMATVVAQPHEEPHPKGVIYGIAIGPDGQPARGIGIAASPLDGVLASLLPRAKTNASGEYRIQDLPWWGKYTVYAEDEDAGYSIFSTGAAGDGYRRKLRSHPNTRKQNIRSTSLQRLVSFKST